MKTQPDLALSVLAKDGNPEIYVEVRSRLLKFSTT